MNVREKISDIDIVVEDIKQFPQTYNSILKDLKTDGTCQTILRRKLNRLIKEGVICKTSIPGTRFGKALYYTIPKPYEILIEGTRLGSDVYVFFKYKKDGKFYIRVNNYWLLKGGEWVPYQIEKIFFEGNVLKWI